MSETPEAVAVETPVAGATDPYQFLASIKGAPSKDTIAAWKAASCSGRVKVFTPDTTGTRVFILRGLSAREMDVISREVTSNPQNATPEKVQAEIEKKAVIMATLWATVPGNKLTEDILFQAPAGLQSALYELICQLSDFVTPMMLERLSADL